MSGGGRKIEEHAARRTRGSGIHTPHTGRRHKRLLPLWGKPVKMTPYFSVGNCLTVQGDEMKLKGFSLIESLLALSILAFVTIASLVIVGKLYSLTQLDMGEVYGAVKQMENRKTETASQSFETFVVEKTVTGQGNGLDEVRITAKHHNGKSILTIKKLVFHEE